MVSQFRKSRWGAFAAPGRVHAAEDGDRHRGQPGPLGQRPASWARERPQASLGVGARSHPEHRHECSGKLAPVPLEEPVSVTAQAPGVTTARPAPPDRSQPPIPALPGLAGS